MPQIIFKKKFDSGPVKYTIFDEHNRPKNLRDIISVGVNVYCKDFRLASDCDDSTTKINFRKSRVNEMIMKDDVLIINNERMNVTLPPDFETGEATVVRGVLGTEKDKHRSGSYITLLKVEDSSGKAVIADDYDRSRGIVTVTFASEDLDATGTYYVEFELFSAPGIKTSFPDVPNNQTIPILVVSQDANNA
jgi:hypothetical protein